MAVIPTSTRYFQPGITVIHFLPTVAAANLVPTRAEITAGTNLTKEVSDISGWAVTSSPITTPDLASRFNSKIGGMTDAADSSLTFYGSKDGVDVRGILPRGTTGFVLFADGGDVANYKADVFPVEVVSVPKQRSMTEAFRLTVDFTITRVPAEDIALPA